MVRSGELCDQGEVLLETPTLIEDALASGVPVTAALLRSDAGAEAQAFAKRLAREKIYELPASVFDGLTTTQTSPGILALAQEPRWEEVDLFSGSVPLVLLLAGLQDPGNLGAILRAGEAFGTTGVVLTRGTVSPFNAKAIRAAAGAVFRMPMLSELTPEQATALLRRRSTLLLAAVARGGRPLEQTDLRRPLAIALGSEGAGLPREIEHAATRVSIPMARQVESLNVASAAAVLLYEIARQRQQGNGASRRERAVQPRRKPR
jgi:TrmH family RNA methyltransferase